MSGLPYLSTTVRCGSCFEELRNDGEGYECEPCGLTYGHDPFGEEPAHFTHEDASPCGGPSETLPASHRKPFKTVNGEVLVWRTWTTVWGPCDLPAFHRSEHHYPASTTYVEDTGK